MTRNLNYALGFAADIVLAAAVGLVVSILLGGAVLLLAA